jgi:RNA polymerase sigma factor (sigma-70 family)
MPSLQARKQAQGFDAVAAEVAAARGGDATAYARLVDAHRNAVCSISLAIVRDLDASEEVAQEVFVAAWRGLPTLRNPDSFGPWLRQLTRNRAREYARSHHRARRRLALVGDHLETVPDPAELAPDELVRAEDQRRLAAAIDQLPDEAREVVTLYYREGRSVAQVAALLELREDAVKKRLQRAREQLRSTLLEEVGQALARTAPTGAFTAAVCGALALGAPSTAAAGTTLIASKAGLSLVGPLLAALPAVAGVAVWFAKPLWDARPGPERREVVRLALLGVAHPVLFALALGAVNLIPGPGVRMAVLVGAWVAFVTSSLASVYVPLLRGRYYLRRAAETVGDPRATARLRLERRLWIGGLAVGLVAGALTLAAIVLRALG